MEVSSTLRVRMGMCFLLRYMHVCAHGHAYTTYCTFMQYVDVYKMCNIATVCIKQWLSPEEQFDEIPL